MFLPPRNRDASASIRGYVYQIDRTVERWLHLGTNQVLELERGEDIDLVSQMIAAGNTPGSEERLLEQIKHRENSLTLRTDAAIEALANFHDHRLHNPCEDLRFCFLTNAAVGCEQLNPFPNRVPGITLWEQIRNAQLGVNDLSAAISQVRQFLVNLAKPDSLPDAVWSAWKGFLGAVPTQEFRVFIERFEWSTGQPDAVEMPIAIRGTILSRGFARDGVEPEAIADRLFVHVMRLLSTTGVKRLTAEERSRVLAAPTLPASDRNVLVQLRVIVAEHTDRLDQLEVEVSALGGQVETLFLAGTTQRVGLAVPAPDLTSPAPVPRLSPRRETVAELRRVLESTHWLALHGGPDTGKTQLAIQVAGGSETCRGWVRFHHAQLIAEAHRVLEAALVTMAGWRHPPPRADWFADAFGAAGANTIVVLDDLPRIPGDDPFAEWLSRMAQAALAAGIRILSTSQFELPLRLRHGLGVHCLTDRTVPPFTDVETGDLFRVYGADDALLTERRLRFLNGLAAGHPLLLTATAEFLANRGWRYREEEIDALLRGDHTRQLLPEVVDRLIRTLGESPRQFLYRLSLPIGSFDQADMTALASVSPAVERPVERLNELLGAWIQRDTDTRFAVSPLVKPLGRSELAPDVRKSCYRQLAEVIAFKREMNPLEGERAIFYNVEAGENGRAVTLYLLFLVETLREPRAEHVVPLIDKWRTAPLPEDVSVGNRLFVRAYQLAAFTKFKLDTRFVVRDTDALLAQATDRDGWAIVSVAVQNMRWFGRMDPGRLLRYIRRAMDLPRIYGPDGRVMVLDHISIPDLLWMVVADLRTPDLLRQWFDAVEAMPKRHRARFWDSDLGRQGVWILPNRVYTTEWEKPQAEQDWDGVLEALAKLLVRAQRLRQPRLEAVVTGVMLEILGDRKRVAETPRLAEPTLARWPTDPDVQFRVRGIWGRQYAHLHQPDLALPLLDTALAQPHAADDHGRLRCLLAANICVGEQDLHYAERARELARSSASAPPIEAARALGEYAISLFRSQGGQAGALTAFPAWSEAMRRYFGVPRKDMIWRDLFPVFAHATSYLFHLAREGAAPEQTIEGGVFVAPSRGFLLTDYMPGREAYYCESGHASVALLLQSYATAARADAESAYWMRMAVEESRRTGAAAIQVASGKAAVAEMLAAGQFEDAVEMGVFVGRGMVTNHARGPKTRETFEGVGFDVAAEFTKLPEDQRLMGDRFALITGLIPTAMAVVRLSLTDAAAAVGAGNRVAAMCRELAEDPSGDRELWRTASEFFAVSSVESTNTTQIVGRLVKIEGDGEKEIAIRILGYVLCSWHASPDEAMASHLGMIETLLRWFSPGESVYRLILMPFIECYWRYIAEHRRFALRAPDLVIAALESAARTSERDRVYAVLSAAAGSFRIRGAQEILQRLRPATS
jgi:hypothetical protein